MPLPAGREHNYLTFGVLDGERSHTIAFTEQCADHYTTNTIENLAGALGIEPKLTESKSVVLPLHNAPTRKQDRIKLVLPLHQTVFLLPRSRTAPLLFKSIVVFNFAVTILNWSG